MQYSEQKVKYQELGFVRKINRRQSHNGI
jgi:hypothetical protein